MIPNYSELAYVFANLFFKKEDFEMIADSSGYSPGLLVITNSAINNWIFLLKDAQQDGNIRRIVEEALKRKPNNQYLRALLDDKNGDIEDPYAKKPVQLLDMDIVTMKEALTMNSNTLQPIFFLERGARKSRCVAYIRTPKKLGTGFLVKNQYLITNNHVIDSVKTAMNSVIVFDFQRNIDGDFMERICLQTDPEAGFATDEKTDWTIVKLKTDKRIEDFGHLELASDPCIEKDFVNIIQHPGGDEKQIGIYHNMVTSVKDGIVQYLTDTQEGSSGAPVFNSNWEVVALHHSSQRQQDKASGDLLFNQGAAISVVKKQIESRIKGIEL